MDIGTFDPNDGGGIPCEEFSFPDKPRPSKLSRLVDLFGGGRGTSARNTGFSAVHIVLAKPSGFKWLGDRAAVTRDWLVVLVEASITAIRLFSVSSEEGSTFD